MKVQHERGLAVSTAESGKGISLLSAMAGRGTSSSGTQEWMRKSFLLVMKSMQGADRDIQIAAMLCASKFEKLAKEQATQRAQALELMGPEESAECEQIRPLETFFHKICVLALHVAASPELLVLTDIQFLGLVVAADGDNKGIEAMSVSFSSSPMSAGLLLTTTGMSTMDTPAVASNNLAVDMQGMTVESGTPTKQVGHQCLGSA